MLLWELLVGRPPAFEELQSRPSPSSRNPSLDLPGADAVVARALAPDPSERFASAEDLQRALGPMLPPTFVGDTALAEFVGRCYDVETERRRLREMVQEASPLLANESAPSGVPFKEGRRTPTVITAQPARTRRWITWGWISAFVSCSALVVVLIVRRNPPSSSVTLPRPDDSKWLRMDTDRTTAPAAPVPQPAEPVLSNPPKIVAARGPTAARPAPKAGTPASPQVPHRPASALPAGVMLDRATDDLEGGDYASAQRDAEAVLRDGTVSQKSRAHYIVGKVAIELGRPKTGADEFAKAIQLDPQNVAAANELSHIRHRGEAP